MRARFGVFAACAVIICSAGTLASTTWVVDDDGFARPSDCDDVATPAFTTIQAAVNAAGPGDTIKICPGLYVEQVVISGASNLTLIGSGSGSNPAVDTIIQSPASLPFSFVTGPSNFPIVAVMNSDDVAIQNLRVDGAGNGNLNYRFIGVAYRESDGAVSNCVITGIRNTPIDGSQHGVALWCFNDLAGPYTLGVTNVTLADYQKNGTVFGGPGLTVNMSGCTISGAGAVSFIAQNGVQVCCGADATVTNTAIAGHTYTPATVYSTGLLAINDIGDPPASVILSNVTLTDNQSSAYLFDYDGTISNSSLTTGVPGVSSDGIDAVNTGAVARGAARAGRPIQPYQRDGKPTGDEKAGSASRTPPNMIVSVSNCSIDGNDAANTAGVYAYSDGATLTLGVSDSTVTNWDYGFYIDEQGGTINTTANANCITSNVSYGFYTAGGTTTVQNAENNYWGGPNGFGPFDPLGSVEADYFTCAAPAVMRNSDGAGDAVSDLYVDYCPWLGSCEGSLTLEITDLCVSGGETQVVVEVWMRGLAHNVTGFFAHVAFDSGRLTYFGGTSSYTAAPFPLHLPPAIGVAEISPGVLQLNGSDTFGGGGTSSDSHLATLVFNVQPAGFPECTPALLAAYIDTFGGFPTELSFQGIPVQTGLVNSLFVNRDVTPPIASSTGPIASCYPNVAAAEAAAQAATSFSDNCGAVSVSVSTVGTCSATVTVRGTDGCGNFTDQSYSTRIDNTAPVLSTVSGNDIPVRADAGGCTALVSLSITANDNCDGAVAVSYALDTDNNTGNGYELPITNPYAFNTGVNSVLASATDSCGNVGTYAFTVTVQAVNRVIVSLRLDSVASTGSRCIRVVPLPGGCSSDDVHVSVNFNSPSVPGVQALNVPIDIPCGAWTAICVKDEQHTLWFTTTITDTGVDYAADNLVTLRSGDTDNDSDVDINDVTWFLFTFGNLAASGGCPWNGTRDADFDLNGAVGAGDYSILSAPANWLKFSTCACSPPRGGGLTQDEPLPATMAGASRSTAGLPAEVAAMADLDRDGVVNWVDVQLFEAKYGFDGSLSSAMRSVGGAPADQPRVKRLGR
ncbi:MAG: hypothetical protein U1D55_13335 [Phycisphaerae bacterium]